MLLFYYFQGFWLIIVNKHKVLGKYVVLTVHTQGQQLHIYTVHAPAKKSRVAAVLFLHRLHTLRSTDKRKGVYSGDW